MYIFAHNIISDFEVCKARQMDQIPFRHYCMCSLQKHNLEPSELMGIVTDCMPSVIGSKMVVYLFCKSIYTSLVSRIN